MCVTSMAGWRFSTSKPSWPAVPFPSLAYFILPGLASARCPESAPCRQQGPASAQGWRAAPCRRTASYEREFEAAELLDAGDELVAGLEPDLLVLRVSRDHPFRRSREYDVAWLQRHEL